MMHLKNQQTPRYKLVLAIPIFLAVFFTFSCQTEEEMEQEAIAATYEDVQAQILDVGKQLQLYAEKYFEGPANLRNAVNEESQKMKMEGPPPSYESLQLKVYKEVASSGDYSKIEKLLERQSMLQQKMMNLPDPDGVYTVVENQPGPEEGMAEFYKFIGENMKYPVQARRMGVEGKVFVQFVVNEYGELTEFQALKGIGAGCDAEAIRVLKEAPSWKPGTTDGKAVKVRMVMPITFKLDDGNAKTEEQSSKELSKLENANNNLEEIVLVAYVN